MDPHLTGIAYHEAGHAIVALWYGLPVVRLWINANGDGGTDYVGTDAHLPLHSRFVLRLAGGAAQQHFNMPANSNTMLDDYCGIITLTPDMTEDERRPFLNDALAYAATIIARNAAEVERLAAIVLEKKSVNISEVHPPIAAAR